MKLFSTKWIWNGIAPVLLFSSLSLIPAMADDLPDGPGKEVFSKVCSQCHGLDIITALKQDKPQWKATVDQMASMGASATDDQFDMIVEYLAKNFGPPPKAAGAAPAAAPAAAAKAEGPLVMPEGAGKDIIGRNCTGCHAPDSFARYRHTPEEWVAITTRMGQRVPGGISKDDLDTVTKYLTASFPKVADPTKVDINKAAAADMLRLGFTESEAQAIVAYRTAHGNFREWGEMLVIYGVDGRKVAAAKDRMSF